MREIETDYLVVGAGATGLAFVDALITSSDADVVIVDRRYGPGGHWLDAYPFVRLHSPSANYGVTSRVLGSDRIDETGPNAGFYERATAAEVVDYFNTVLEADLIPSGRVRFFGMCDYRGNDADGHTFVSLVSGQQTRVKVRRRFVDATYVESTIPSRHIPAFDIDPGVRMITPNDLVDQSEAATGYTVIGGGKTSMDTCNWLMGEGVAPDDIRWVRPRDPWINDRAYMQPLQLVGSYMQLQASWVQACAEAESAKDFAHRLEAEGIFVRLDPDIEPDAYRGAILSATELESLRRIENVVRLGRVRRIATDRITLDEDEVATGPGHVYVDCTAAGVTPTTPRPIFEPDRITLQYVTIGNVPYGAATVGTVEALREDIDEKNRLCPPLTFTGRISDVLEMAHSGMTGIAVRGGEPDLAAWNEACRLNNSRGAADHMDDPRVPAAFEKIGAHFGGAMQNLERLVSSGR